MAASISETNQILANPSAADPATVASNIDAWIADLQPLGSAGHSLITDLTDLKAELASTTPDGSKIGPLMAKLGKATTQAAGGNPDLKALGAQLSKLGA